MKNILLTIFALFLCACGTSPTITETGPPVDSAVANAEYGIGVDDVVRIDVWRRPELGVTVPVRPDGMVSVPLIGDVLAAGKTPEELSEEVEQQLAEYVKDPVVAVILTEIHSQEYLSRVRVTGAVREPVSLSFRKGMTVIDAILAAGGVTEFAVPQRSMLYRKTAEGVKSYPVELATILNRGDLTTNYDLRPGDIITVPERVF